VLEESVLWLGIGLTGFVNIFNPQVIALGGRAMGAGELILAYARKEVCARARRGIWLRSGRQLWALLPACSAQKKPRGSKQEILAG
jgi:predicted NBD/HSP70 family sugar kinase